MTQTAEQHESNKDVFTSWLTLTCRNKYPLLAIDYTQHTKLTSNHPLAALFSPRVRDKLLQNATSTPPGVVEISIAGDDKDSIESAMQDIEQQTLSLGGKITRKVKPAKLKSMIDRSEQTFGYITCAF